MREISNDGCCCCCHRTSVWLSSSPLSLVWINACQWTNQLHQGWHLMSTAVQSQLTHTLLSLSFSLAYHFTSPYVLAMFFHSQTFYLLFMQLRSCHCFLAPLFLPHTCSHTHGRRGDCIFKGEQIWGNVSSSSPFVINVWLCSCYNTRAREHALSSLSLSLPLSLGKCLSGVKLCNKGV